MVWFGVYLQNIPLQHDVYELKKIQVFAMRPLFTNATTSCRKQCKYQVAGICDRP